MKKIRTTLIAAAIIAITSTTLAISPLRGGKSLVANIKGDSINYSTTTLVIRKSHIKFGGDTYTNLNTYNIGKCTTFIMSRGSKVFMMKHNSERPSEYLVTDMLLGEIILVITTIDEI